MMLDPTGIPYGSELTLEQRVARLEQKIGATVPLACRVRRSAAYTLGSGATGAMSFDTVERNDNGLWTAGDPTRIYLPKTGWWSVGAEFAFVQGAAGPCATHMQVTEGGVTRYIGIDYAYQPVSQRCEQNVATTFYLANASGAYITAFPYQPNGVTVNSSTAELTNYMFAVYQGA